MRRPAKSQSDVARARGVGSAEDPTDSESAGLDLSVLDDLPGCVVRLVQLRMFQLFHDRFSRSNLSPGVFCALVVIGANPGVRAGQLGDALMIRRSNMTKLVDTLERRKLVRRTPSDLDRRSVELSLTEAGRKLVDEIMPDILAHESFVLSVLSVHERHMFLGLLGKFNEVIRTLRAPPA